MTVSEAEDTRGIKRKHGESDIEHNETINTDVSMTASLITKTEILILTFTKEQSISEAFSQMLERRQKQLQNGDGNEEEDSSSESSDEGETDSNSEDESASKPANAGIIEKLVLKNFMCHDSFEIQLGPQINFIIGKNGSGKSAILTALSVGLGAKASDTSRGSSIKDLIKDGKSTARVLIVFKNEGIEAYKPDIFGSRIVIERKIQKQGANGYFVRSESMETISTKKAVLDEILYNFNITVDNPLIFLSQDKAREFLSTTKDEAKYEYFMAGSLINNIIENYRLTSVNISEVRGKLKIAQSHYEASLRKYEKAVSLYNKFKKSDSLRKKLENIHGKIYWYNVSVIERKIQKYRDQMNQAAMDINFIDGKIEGCKTKSDSHTNQKKNTEKRIEELTESLKKDKNDYQEQRNTYQFSKASASDIASEIKKSEQEIEDLRMESEHLKQKIEEEEKRQAELNGESGKSLSDRIEHLKDYLEHSNQDREKKRSALSELNNNEHPELSRCEREINSCNEIIGSLRQRKRDTIRYQKDRYAPWGHKMTEFLQHVKSIKSWNHVPIGPIGIHVYVKEEYSEWSDLVNTALGRTLDSFLVSSEHDRTLLQDLLKKYRINKNIITRSFESFDYEEGIAKNHTTFLDILSVENHHVLYTLIDTNNIEKNIITNDMTNIRELVTQKNVLGVFSLLNNRSGQRSSGDRSTFRIDPVYYRLNEPRKLSHRTVSHAKELEEIDKFIDHEVIKVNKLERRAREIKISIQDHRQTIENEYQELVDSVRKCADELYRLENSVGEDAAISKIDFFSHQRIEKENQINRKLGMADSLNEDFEAERKKLIDLKNKLSEFKGEIQEKSDEIDGKKELLIELDIESSALASEKTHYEVTRGKRVEISNESERKIKQGEEKLASLVSEAESKCPRNDVILRDDDTSESITAEYEHTQEAIAEAEKTIGKSYEDMQKELIDNKTLKEGIEKQVIEMDKIVRILANDLNTRFNYMQTTILKSIDEAASSFERSLALRGFKGELKFEFSNKKLVMLVQTKGDIKKRTVESLSGGEKSFTQIALLLAIWKVMDTKIRGLDEFDVFMDSVNRTISLKLLLSELRQYPKSQSIFVTPQDIAMVGDLNAKDIKIHKMNDPRMN